MGAPHAARLERFIGKEQIDDLVRNMRGWYGPPINVSLPGANRIAIHGDGDFSGRLSDGFFGNSVDMLEALGKRVLSRWAKQQSSTMNAGFSSVTDLVTKATNSGKRQVYPFAKAGNGGLGNTAASLWRVGTLPAAAGAASAAPGGDALSNASAGAINFGYAACVTGDTEHYAFTKLNVSTNQFGLLLYDRLFQVNKTMNSVAAEAVTGVPTRYTNTVQGAVDSAEGNFIFTEVQTVLPATAHNWTPWTYTNQAGTAARTMPSLPGVASQPVGAFDHPVAQWFAPLQAGDTGVKSVQNIQCDALVATGAIAVVIGHPIAWLPAPISTFIQEVGGINLAFNLARIFDNACLALIEPPKFANNGLSWTGAIHTVRG